MQGNGSVVAGFATHHLQVTESTKNLCEGVAVP